MSKDTCPKCGMPISWTRNGIVGAEFICGSREVYDGGNRFHIDQSDPCKRIAELTAENSRLVAMLANKGIHFLPNDKFEVVE